MKLEAIKEIKGKLILKSGLHIGAGDMEMKIGGVDNPVIKHPHTQEPYIPGSSLKGKVRSLLEMRSGLMAKTDGEPVSVKTIKACNGNGEKEACVKILKLFGSSGAETDPSLGPTRVSFADCPLDDEWRKKAIEQHLAFTEVKSENRINRIEGTAKDPRFSERVPSGAEFKFTVTLKLLNQNESDLEIFLMEGLKLLQLDALGGSGSRGYGRIEFEFDDQTVREAFEKVKPLV
ncbi:CRISPR subtype III-A/MTUBE-associated RAMP protein Csm3 [uncultured Desulfobacterium sp.]|uniref:CRISPR system Cms endoribonuclease Csm3 n=1 Tax=uncultured Desulfobacterium sp. TaxID=201089 RepID=A0A445MUF8_9BACT|nr:CRISPR subtype III-A/MTUBE-associated RAMP protein Csm3 [uncultured Desulfobacterium sp.]